MIGRQEIFAAAQLQESDVSSEIESKPWAYIYRAGSITAIPWGHALFTSTSVPVGSRSSLLRAVSGSEALMRGVELLRFSANSET